MESFDATSTTDESPQELAKEQREKNVMEKTGDIFAEMFGKPYETASKKPDYDLDMSKPNVTIDHKQIGIKKMPKGW